MTRQEAKRLIGLACVILVLSGGAFGAGWGIGSRESDDENAPLIGGSIFGGLIFILLLATSIWRGFCCSHRGPRVVPMVNQGGEAPALSPPPVAVSPAIVADTSSYVQHEVTSNPDAAQPEMVDAGIMQQEEMASLRSPSLQRTIPQAAYSLPQDSTQVASTPVPLPPVHHVGSVGDGDANYKNIGGSNAYLISVLEQQNYIIAQNGMMPPPPYSPSSIVSVAGTNTPQPEGSSPHHNPHQDTESKSAPITYRRS